MERVDKIKKVINNYFYARNREYLSDEFLNELASLIDISLVNNITYEPPVGVSEAEVCEHEIIICADEFQTWRECSKCGISNKKQT
jgi:hypothetical protein